MHTYCSEGIILQILNFQDYDRILTVFSCQEGLIKLIVKGANRLGQQFNVCATPFTCAEFIYTKGKSDLFKCREISILQQNLGLRNRLSSLEAASDMSHALLSSQGQHDPAPHLYRLFKSYLEKIAHFNDPYTLAASLRLKILRHDGLFGLTPTCCSCFEVLKAHHTFMGESYCPAHAPLNSLILSEVEMNDILLLTYCTLFSQIEEIAGEALWREKISPFFKAQVE